MLAFISWGFYTVKTKLRKHGRRASRPVEKLSTDHSSCHRKKAANNWKWQQKVERPARPDVETLKLLNNYRFTDRILPPGLSSSARLISVELKPKQNEANQRKPKLHWKPCRRNRNQSKSYVSNIIRQEEQSEVWLMDKTMSLNMNKNSLKAIKY